MMKISGDCIEEGQGEIPTIGFTKYFHFSAVWQGYFSVEEGRTRTMGNTQTTVTCCSTFNRLHLIHLLWLLSIIFYQLIQIKH